MGEYTIPRWLSICLIFEVWTIFIAPGGYFCALRISQGQHSTQHVTQSFTFPWRIFQKKSTAEKMGPINQKMLFINSVIDFSPTYQTVNWPTTVWCDLSCSWPVTIWILEISAVAIFSSLNCRVSWARVLCVIFRLSLGSFVVSFGIFVLRERALWLWVWENDENDLRKRGALE